MWSITAIPAPQRAETVGRVVKCDQEAATLQHHVAVIARTIRISWLYIFHPQGM